MISKFCDIVRWKRTAVNDVICGIVRAYTTSNLQYIIFHDSLVYVRAQYAQSNQTVVENGINYVNQWNHLVMFFMRWLQTYKKCCYN